MIYNQLNKTDAKISAIGLGTWVFSGDCWGPIKEAESIETVHAAFDQGMNLIDTAPIYGWGHSEQVIGKALKGRRDQAFIATKCGLVKKGKGIGNDLSSQNIKNEVEQSLSRLGTDYIDLYQCHWPDDQTPLEETCSTLNQLVEQGKIRYIGVSNFTKDLLKEALQYSKIVTLQSQYSLLERKLENEILPFCQESEVKLMSYGVLGGGVLSGKYKKEEKFSGGDVRSFFYKNYKGERFEKILDVVESMRAWGKPLSQIAINWVRKNQAVGCVLVGCRNIKQLQGNIGAVEWELTEEQYDFMNGVELANG